MRMPGTAQATPQKPVSAFSIVQQNGKTASEEEISESGDSVNDLVAPIAQGARPRSILRSEGSASLPPAGRTVSWQDFSGKELHTVREFAPR